MLVVILDKLQDARQDELTRRWPTHTWSTVCFGNASSRPCSALFSTACTYVSRHSANTSFCTATRRWVNMATPPRPPSHQCNKLIRGCSMSHPSRPVLEPRRILAVLERFDSTLPMKKRRGKGNCADGCFRPRWRNPRT